MNPLPPYASDFNNPYGNQNNMNFNPYQTPPNFGPPQQQSVLPPGFNDNLGSNPLNNGYYNNTQFNAPPPPIPPDVSSFYNQPMPSQNMNDYYPPPQNFPPQPMMNTPPQPVQVQTSISNPTTHTPMFQSSMTSYVPPTSNPNAPPVYMPGPYPTPASTMPNSIPVGRKKALLIGINYTGTAHQLRGCINDVKNVLKFLMELYGYQNTPETMLVLTDDQQNPSRQPTKANMLNGMRWLVDGARPGDSLFFHFSGHGSQQADTDGDEDDGLDETVLPVDFRTAGMIVDDLMHDILVKPLQQGVRLTALFDSCHSGSSLDLPFTYMSGPPTAPTASGNNMMNMLMGGGGGGGNDPMSALLMGITLLTGGKKNRLSSLLGKKQRPHMSQEEIIRRKSSPADVFYFGGSMDSQTCADTNIQGTATGAMSFAFLKALRENKNISYKELLAKIRSILHLKYSQLPQISTSHPMNLDQPFML